MLLIQVVKNPKQWWKGVDENEIPNDHIGTNEIEVDESNVNMLDLVY